jgi:hypothetical protein
MLRGQGTRREDCRDHVDLESNQLRRRCRKPIGVCVRRARFQNKILSVDKTQLAQSLAELGTKGSLIPIGEGEHPNSGHF